MVKKIFFLSLISFFLLLNVAQAGLVPCGLNEDDPNQPGDQTKPCTWNHFYELFKNIIDFLIYNLVFPISAVMIVVGGFFIMTAGDSSEKISKGKEIITAAVVGLLIALLAWLIIDTIIKILTDGQFGPWNEI